VERTKALCARGHLPDEQAARVRQGEAAECERARGKDRLPHLQRAQPQTNTKGELFTPRDFECIKL
jgi:hypothetical protein